MPFGTKVGLGPDDSVLDGDPAPSPQSGRSTSQIFGPFLLWPNGWMHQDMPPGMEVGLVLRDVVFDVDPATTRKREHPPPLKFWPMSIVTKWLDG